MENNETTNNTKKTTTKITKTIKPIKKIITQTIKTIQPRKIKICLVGILGKMGQSIVEESFLTEDIEIVAGVDRRKTQIFGIPVYDTFDIAEDFDILVDFSNYSLSDTVLDYAAINYKKLIIGTTGQSQEYIQKLKKQSKRIPILYAPNMSLSIAMIHKMCSCFNAFSDVYEKYIIESHHKNKQDLPSGTAKLLSDSAHVDKSKIFSIRAGNIAGEHKLILIGENDKIEITHTAYNRKIYTQGLFEAIRLINIKTNGFFSIKDVLFNKK